MFNQPKYSKIFLGSTQYFHLVNILGWFFTSHMNINYDFFSSKSQLKSNKFFKKETNFDEKENKLFAVAT